MADSAVMQVAQSNSIVLVSADGSAIQGCLQGTTDTENGYMFWIGGATPSAANFKVKYNGYGEFKGTVRASNFYHGVHILGQTEMWYRIKVQDSEGKLKQGEYYTEAQIDESGADDYEVDDTIGCTGPSDIILLPIDVSGEVREVRLPDPKDYEGKVVEISDLNYSDASPHTGTITVSALGITQTTVEDGENGFTAGIYSGSWAGASLNHSFPKGTKVRYLALHYQNSYYWCLIDKSLYKLNE